MKNPVHLTKAINPVRDSRYRSPLRRGLPRVHPIWIIRGFLLIPLALACLALSRTAEAALDPSDTAYGTGALSNEAGGTHNSAFGFNALYSNTTGLCNTANGAFALYSNTAINGYSGHYNTANGYSALYHNTTGYSNTATGFNALYSNTTGQDNTANGSQALVSNITGYSNTASGLNALYSNTTGYDNTATGGSALESNTTGVGNAVSGFNALHHNTTGNGNTANGYQALYYNTTGNGNTANGYQALYHNTGVNNVGLGNNAGYNLTTGFGNVCIGSGVFGAAGESNTTRIRNVYSSVASARAVYVNSDNKIGTLVSSRRFKDEIKLMDKASEAILALKPVTFRYKKEIEPNGAIMFGLIAEEVEKVDPDLVTRNDKGEVETVRYDAVNAMLLNEFLKEHRKVEEQDRRSKEQEATIAQLTQDFQSKLAEQQTQINAVTTGLRKVSAQLEARGSAPRTVLNNQ
jgi:hypothetical protein